MKRNQSKVSSDDVWDHSLTANHDNKPVVCSKPFPSEKPALSIGFKLNVLTYSSTNPVTIPSPHPDADGLRACETLSVHQCRSWHQRRRGQTETFRNSAAESRSNWIFNNRRHLRKRKLKLIYINSERRYSNQEILISYISCSHGSNMLNEWIQWTCSGHILHRNLIKNKNKNIILSIKEMKKILGPLWYSLL